MSLSAGRTITRAIGCPTTRSARGATSSSPPPTSRSRSPGRWLRSSSSPRPPTTPTSSWCCACSIRQGREITFIGSNDPRTPIANGWLRASHRKLDPARSLPYRPYHIRTTKPGRSRPDEPVELDVEIWPSSIVVPPGYRLCLSVRGKDYAHEGPPVDLAGVKYTLTGVGPFLHVHPQDRPGRCSAEPTLCTSIRAGNRISCCRSFPPLEKQAAQRPRCCAKKSSDSASARSASGFE